MKTTDNQKEIFVVVDKDDNIIDYRTRAECHSDKSLIHRSTCVIIFNSKGEIALQKRSMTKDLYPGYYALSASGHVGKGETYEEAAKREMSEEIGIEVPITFVTKFLFHAPLETEYNTIFTAKSDGPFVINKEEVEEIKFFTKEDIKLMKDKLTPSSVADLMKIGIL